MSNEINLQEFKMHEKDSGSSSYQIARHAPLSMTTLPRQPLP